MSKKKVKANKAKKKQKENKYFFGALLTIGALLVVGIAATVIFGNPGGSAVSSGGGGATVLNQMNDEFGQKWRDLGFTNWTHTDSGTMLYMDSTEWAKLSPDEQKKRINTAGKDFEKIIDDNGGDTKNVYIMIHNERNEMPATYSSASGAEFFRQ